MTGETRRKLSMALRALDFSKAYPSDDTSHAGIVAQLGERVARADALAIAERDGQVMERAALSRRKISRLDTQRRLLRHLVVVGTAAAKDHPALAKLFTTPKFGAPNKGYHVAAQAMLAAAREHHALLLGYGLGESFLAEFDAAVALFAAATDQAHTGKRAHIGARAELEEVTDQCVGLVRRLDGLNRMRFKETPSLLAIWESARNVVGPFHPRLAEEVVEEEPAVPLLPSGGEAVA